MRLCAPVACIGVLALAVTAASAQNRTPREVVKHYSIPGTTGPDLYQAIGDIGPLIGNTRVIAHTNWDLKWRRDYRPDGTSCVLASALPFLTITYTLPKPSARLSGAAARNWAVFADGIAAHEKVHGRDIAAMVDAIIAATVALRVEGDPDCQAIRAEVRKRVTAANHAYKARSRAFDQTEMADGGMVHRLILALVNGR